MAAYQVFNIVFSIVLLPVNIYCAFWLFQEALNLTGMTFREFLESTSVQRPFSDIGRHRLRKKQRFFIKFFKKHSSDPKRSIQLLWSFGLCTLPGLAALNIAIYAAIHIDKQNFALIGNLILLIINALLFVWGKFYRKNHPLDNESTEKLTAKQLQEKDRNRKIQVKSIVVYALVGVFFFGIILFFMLGISGLSNPQRYPQSHESAVTVHADLIEILNKKGFETANISTTYWKIDENKLLHVAAGVKGSTKIEFYGYSDSETVDLAYNQMVYLTAQDMENAERESYETTLPEGNKIFSAAIDGVYYLIMYRNDTVIYACSKSSLKEIKEILLDLGYLENKE